MKYIIEFEDEPFGRNDDPVIPHGMDELYRAKGFKSLVFDKNGLNKLTPYTNIDTKEKAEEFGRGYDAGWDAGSKFHEAEKESIEDEVWSFAWKIYNMDIGEYAEIFDDKGCPSDYREAKAKYEAWLKQKEEIHVGDEVAFEMAFGNGLDNNMKAVALDQAATGEEWCVLTENGCIETHDEEDLYKTGRHFDEVAELLEKMRGEEQ